MKSRGLDSKQSWVVAIASGVVFLMVSLPFRLGSLLFVSIIERYGVNRKNASSPFILAYLMRSVSGPFAGYFSQLFGLQEITILGCLFCAIGVGACFFAEDIVAVDVFLGIIFGIGYGWSTALVPEILNRHFKNHRAKANGIFFGMSGLGASIAPPFLKAILFHFGVSGTFLIMSAIMLNSIPFAMILITPKLKRQNLIQRDASKIPSSERDFQILKNQEHFSLKNMNVEGLRLSLQSHVGIHSVENSDLRVAREDKSISKKNHSKTIKNQNLHNNSSCLIDQCQFCDEIVETESINTTPNIISGASMKSSFLALSILWNPLFLLITSVQSSSNYVVYVFWTITVDLVRDKDIEQHLEVYFVTALALLDTLGRFFLASNTDGDLMAVENFSACCLALMGLSCFLMTLVSGFWATMSVICLISVISSGNTTSQPGIITKFIPGERRSMAMASRYIMYAPMSFTVPYLIGYFRGIQGSYDGLLYFMTCMCIVCSFLLIFLPRLSRCC